METCLKVLLIVGMVTAAPAPSSSPLPSHKDAVLAAVQLYNQEPGTTLAYRLLEAEPQPDWDMSSKTIQTLRFIVKETVCLVSEKRDINQCEFKEDGLVKDCSGFFSTEKDPPSVIIKCEEASEEVGVIGLPTQLSVNPTGHRMETCLKVLLILGVVTAAPAPSSSPLPTHEDAVLAAVQLYNQEPDITLAYRLLEAEPQPDWDVSSKTIQPLTFTVQETVCPVKEKRDISQCEFKEDGLVKDCSGFFSTEQDPASVIIKCEEASEEVTYKRAFPGRDRVVHPLSLNPTGHRMETGLKVLLILGVVTAAPAPSSSPLPTHEDAVLAAVQLYNQEPDITLAYRLLEAEPQPDWDVSSKTIQPLTFTVQETVCPVKEKRDISQCEFKEDGLVKDCSGFFSTEQNPASVIIKCEEASEEPNIVTRGRWSRFRKRAGRFLRRHKEKIIRAAVDIFLS
ncbi:unnamed protein product [Natator depressus]